MATRSYKIWLLIPSSNCPPYSFHSIPHCSSLNTTGCLQIQSFCDCWYFVIFCDFSAWNSLSSDTYKSHSPLSFSSDVTWPLTFMLILYKTVALLPPPPSTPILLTCLIFSHNTNFYLISYMLMIIFCPPSPTIHPLSPTNISFNWQGFWLFTSLLYFKYKEHG